MTSSGPPPPEVLVVTGAGGMLGKELGLAAAARGSLLAPWDRGALDVTDRDAVMRRVEEARPSVVVHAAAWTDVDGCEADSERAFLVNGEGTAHVAEACRESGARLLTVSTDYVFSGDAADPYREDDAVGPLSVYGESKLAGELATLALGEAGTVARTAWVYAGHGHNFLRTMLRLGKDSGEIAVVDDQRGSPTFAADLANALLDVVAAGGSGVYHITNSGDITWHGFASKIFDLAGYDVVARPVTSEEFPRPAKRPANSVLRNTRFAAEGIPMPPPWEDGLRRCLAGTGALRAVR